MTEAIERASQVLLGDGTKLEDVLKALVQEPNEEIASPSAPKAITLSDEAHRALQVLPAVFGRVQVESIRTLTLAEQEKLGEEALVLDALTSDFRARRDAISEAIRNHLDQAAVASGQAYEAPKDRNGHYVLGAPKNPATLPIPGTNRKWSSEYRSGRVTVSGDELLRLYEAGEIDRATYLSFTKEVRVLDEEKVYKAVRKQPSLLGVLAKITKRGLPGSSLNIRKQ